MADANNDPYFAEAYHFAAVNWTNYGLAVGKTPNPAKLARLQVSTLNHLRAFKRTGPPTTASHILAAARYGVAQAERDFSPNATDVAGSFTGQVTNTVQDIGKNAGNVLAPLHGIAAIGELAVNVTELMSGKKHVLLRTTYVIFGGLALLAGVAILARELGMKPPVDVTASLGKKPKLNVGPVTVSPKLPKAVKVTKPKAAPKPKSTLKAKGATA